MSAIFGGPDHYILLCAKNYATALTEYRKTADDKRPALQSNMNYLLESAKLEVEAEQRRREKHLRSDIRSLVRDRKPLAARLLVRSGRNPSPLCNTSGATARYLIGPGVDVTERPFRGMGSRTRSTRSADDDRIIGLVRRDAYPRSNNWE